MNPIPRLFALALAASALLATPAPLSPRPAAARQGQALASAAAVAGELIRRQRYDDAITRLEQALEAAPGDAEALTFLATARLYAGRDFLRAQREFEAAHAAGGGAVFLVSHSHEKLSGSDFSDYCRGWLRLNRDAVEFVAFDGPHGFRLPYREVSEFKQNRWSKKLFHVKLADENQNFRGRTGDESEALLILALYKKFSR